MYSISSTLQHLVTDAFSTLSVNILTYLLIHWIVKTDYTQSLIRTSLEMTYSSIFTVHLPQQNNVCYHYYNHNHFTALLNFVQDYPGEPVPEI